MLRRLLTATFTICLVLARAGGALAQEPQYIPVSSEVLKSPLMKETEAWVKRELPKLGSDYVVKSDGKSRFGTKYEVEKTTLSDCRLTFRAWESTEPVAPVESLMGFSLKLTKVVTVPLQAVEVSMLHASEEYVRPGSSASKPSYLVVFVARSTMGMPFTLESSNSTMPDSRKQMTKGASLHVSDSTGANQAIQFFRRAAVLCGASAQGSPPQTAQESSPADAFSLDTKVRSGSPEVSGPSQMSNADVTRMAVAGLSNQVISTAIRQAPLKKFDLTPAGLINLKKAGVSDAVIAAMQEEDGPTSPVVTAKPQDPPKYNAALAVPVPTPAQEACSGIENMGTYKNTIYNASMGGGVVEWLAKVRNNTGVTKIVIIGWRDVYGQEQRTQVQIAGGGIASPRLDMTQARLIPPVTNVRILSCQ